MSKHTPGPWQRGKHDGLYHVETARDGKRIALCKDNGPNANLIAASPDFYDVCVASIEAYLALGQDARDVVRGMGIAKHFDQMSYLLAKIGGRDE